jgi:NADPH:quinone reductase-like Zn-dependent oxidoreductase
MKAVRLQSFGDVDQFRLEDAPDPVAEPGEVLVRVAVSALNPVDLYVRQGMVGKMELPAILGIDGAGTVEAVGSGVTGFFPGDRVIVHAPLKGHGTHAELVVAPAAGVAKLPDGVNFEAGATLPLPGLTGRQLVDALGGVKADDRVLVSGALGAVGRVAVQYLKELGARPVAGVRGERLDEGKALAGDAVDIDQVPSSPGFDYAISAAGPVAGNVIRHVRDAGTMSSAVQVPDGANEGERINIVRIFAHDDAAILQQVADAAGRGNLTIPVAQTFPLEQLGDAHTALAAGARGKILLRH